MFDFQKQFAYAIKDEAIGVNYPRSQKTMGVSPWMNATVGPSKARRAKEGALADSAEERKDTTGVHPWRLHFALSRTPRLPEGTKPIEEL
jgi:hypothetical protein